MRRSSLRVLILLLVGAACSNGDTDRALRGDTVEVVGVWQDAEAAAFEAVLDVFEARTGATAEFTSTLGEDIGEVLDARIAAGDPPDVALLPQPGLLVRYARAGIVAPIDELVGAEVRERYGRVWQQLATVDGALYGVWFKAANKSLVWYSIGAFEQAGVVPPATLDGFVAVADALVASGTPPFSVAAAPEAAWTLTDWFENLYLRVAGPASYDRLASGELPWTDESVRSTLALLAELLPPVHVAGGVPGAQATGFVESVAAVFDPRPSAAMVVEGDFVPGVVAGTIVAELGVDVDVFAFPEADVEQRFVVGGGDVAVLMRATDAGEELLRFLASPEAGEAWAARGGFVSPNEDVDLGVYPDEISRRIARSLLEAGDGFRFDLSDQLPVAFGGTTGAGMWALLRDFLADPSDPAATAAKLELAAVEARAGG